MSSIDVSYTIEGNGDPIYMVHGIGSRRIIWNALIKELKHQFTCVSFDLRGHGESPVPPVPYSLDELVGDLERLRDHLGHESIHIVGHSLGGQVGPAYARTFPERVLTLTLLSTVAGRTPEDSAKVKKVVSTIRKNGVESVLDNLIKRWYTDDFISRYPEAVEKRIQQLIETPPEVFLSVFDIYSSTEMLPWLKQITCPCLVMTGEFDPGCSPHLNQMIVDALPKAELVILDNLKHSILIEGPDKVYPPLLDFLKNFQKI